MGFGSFGPWEILLILVVLLLVFGAKRLPELGGALGKGIREFKSSIRSIESEINTEARQQPPVQQPPVQQPPVQQPPRQVAGGQQREVEQAAAAPRETETAAPRASSSSETGGPHT